MNKYPPYEEGEHVMVSLVRKVAQQSDKTKAVQDHWCDNDAYGLRAEIRRQWPQLAGVLDTLCNFMEKEESDDAPKNARVFDHNPARGLSCKCPGCNPTTNLSE